ncbi:hypothetical protein E3A20_01900 [Planctomyces bekefii]|uniref:DUF4340 domain-containing protein n=1 Tax=Planctomyces bekefii TaxID=1653850 RepID=A0A5C6MD74_9PLAN|nr:hypothetical protein E3A20_01900 [Planctomyces bekefii]
MNSTKRTLMFLGTAGGSLLLAVLVNLASAPKSVDGFSEVGQEFFPDFLDPLKATELSVAKFDTEQKEKQSFSVKKNDQGFWVIPSHHDYPAEAAERLARTAASMIGIRKVAVQSRSKEDWGRYGVQNPEAEAATGADGKDPRGTRLSLKDGSGNGLVDLIVGRAVEGRDSHYYVRQPDKNTVFIAKMTVDLSTKFADWIEPDLLKVNQPDITRILVNRYSVDEQQGTINQGEVLDLVKDRTAGKWGLDGLNTEAEQVKEATVTDLVRNLDQLKIVGVRPKPQGLNADLTVSEEVSQNPLLRQVLQADMQRQGYFVARGPQNSVQLVSNEGELIAGTSNGVRYTLYFGEIARGTAKDIEVGLKSDAAAAENPEAAKEGADGKAAESEPAAADGPEKGPRRYLLVKVDYDEGLLGPKPEEPVAPEKPAILNDGAAPAAPAEGAPAEKPAEAAPAAPAAGEPAPPEAPAPAPAPAPAEAPAEKPAEEKAADPGSCDEPQAAPADAAAASADAAPAVPQDPAPAAPAVPAQDSPAPAAAAPAQPADELKPAADPKAEAQKAFDQAMAEYEAAKAGHAAAVKAWDDRAKEGRKRVKELSERFAGWYYVITAESFEKFQITRESAVEPKTAAPAPGAAPGPGGLGVPGLDGNPLLPPGAGN